MFQATEERFLGEAARVSALLLQAKAAEEGLAHSLAEMVGSAILCHKLSTLKP